MPPSATAEAVQTILETARTTSDRPTDAQLGPCYSFLIPSSADTGLGGPSTSKDPEKEPDHWYCSKAPSTTHRDVASYLLFLFAFKRQGTSKVWLDTLESILKACEDCSRGFGIARREFGPLYMSHYPLINRVNFFRTVDLWQATFILAEARASGDTGYASSSQIQPGSLSSLSPPITQLLMAEPSLLENQDIAAFIDRSIATSPSTPLSTVANLGLTPLLVRLLRSPELERRKWAFIQMQAAARRKVSFEIAVRTGVREELEELCRDPTMDEKERWKIMRTILKKGCLDSEAVEKGLLEGRSIGGKPRQGKGIVAVLAPVLGAESDYFPILLDTFSMLLHVAPSRSFWTFDASPELPHTLYSDIKSNPSFLLLVEDRYNSRSSIPSLPPGDPYDKGKKKASEAEDPLGWITEFLVSLIDDQRTHDKPEVDTGFGEALARIMGDCFQDLQHGRFAPKLRAAAAEAGFRALCALQERHSRLQGKYEIALSSTLSIHAKFITTVAFRPQDHPPPIWSDARDAARNVLSESFRADGKEIVESMLGLSLIASEERKRRARARKAEQKKLPAPPPTPVDKLHTVSVQKELWAAAYETLSPTDAAGTALLIKAIAGFAHVEKLNRNETWSYSELKLQEVVKEDEFIKAVRAINQGIVATCDSFAHAVEALAMQPDPLVVQNLWQQPDIGRDAVILLLSPAEDVHDPTISLIQQSFDNVDDRGDCFRTLLSRYPAQTMDGLCDFLGSFIDTARITPESCSLAKWLVRCFTDVLDALCQASDEEGPLLRSASFTSVYESGKPMRSRILNLWHLMTTSLAVILKRTIDWAPLYDNETMVDWMRDALIFGRQMADNIRAFEAATLSVAGSDSKFIEPGESPAKPTQTGAKLVQKLENVLRDLVSWLRLTDLETLHQTFELIKTIVGRIAKTNPDVSKQPELELTLLELEKFSRKASKSYRTRLSDDLLSEISELLEPFSLETKEDEEQYAKSVATEPRAAPPRLLSPTQTPLTSTKPASKPKDAFAEMMRRSGATTTASSSKPRAASSSAPSARSDPIDITHIDDDDDFGDDGFLESMSAAELDNLEKKVKSSSSGSSTARSFAGTAPRRPPPGQSVLKFPTQGSSSSSTASSKLNIDLVHRPPPKPSSFKSGFMRELAREHRADRAAQFKRDRIIGGVVPKLPPASGLGSGLGVYQGPRRTVQPVDSGSSASESSDDDSRGAAAIVARQKEAKKTARIAQPLSERRPIKIIGNDLSDIMRQRDDRRAQQHALKMRLKPDLNGLYRFVLSWNPSHTGPAPPHHPSLARDLAQMSMVPTVFPDCNRYRKVMLPLFLQELWMQCLKDESRSPPLPIEISSRAYEDDFLDMELTVQGSIPADFYVNDSDIVLLKTDARSVLAKVQGFRRKFKDTAMKVRILALVDDPRSMAVKTRWYLQKHVSLSTALREYGALQGLPYYDAPLLRDILAARSARMPILSSREIEDAMDSFDTNEPQAKAILGAMSIDGFALIQGPPGTGKTKTISGLVGKFMSERGGYIPVNGEKQPKQKILVCAPSNAAIDEVCKRLMNGVPSAHGGRHNPIIVRIGIESSVNIAVKPVALESLVEARVTSSGAGKDGTGDYSRIQADLDNVKKQIAVKQEELRAAQGNDEKHKQVEHEIFALTQRRTQLGQQSSKAKDAARDATRHLEGARRAARDAILNEADIICATLSGAGHDSLAPFSFETVIIDEAAQAIEMSCLIPLKYGCRRCIMVGDPNQLPPTTFSPDAERLHYNESLFVRMVKQNPTNVQLLSIQYRMNPYISELPSKVFYNGQLKDGPNMAAKTAAIWHENPIFGPYRFFNVSGVEQKQGTSTKNTAEAGVAVELYRKIEAQFGQRVNFDMRIGVISMYKEQLWELKRHFIQAYGTSIVDRIEFNTVDGFQGQEKDIIILSCVRSGPNLQTIGFLRDPRRMNVALTRAKSSLFIIGNGPTLERTDERWRTIVGDARERGFFADYDPKLFVTKLEPAPPKKKVKKEPKDTIEKTETSPDKASRGKTSGAPPGQLMDEAKPLKRRSEVEVKVEGEKRAKVESKDALVQDKRKADVVRERSSKEDKKKDKKRRVKDDSSSRGSSPGSVSSDLDGRKGGPLGMPKQPASHQARPPAAPSVMGAVRPVDNPTPRVTPNGTGGSSAGPSRPAHAGMPPLAGPKQITKPSAGSAALFITKKRKKPPPPSGPRPPGPPIKQAINNSLHAGRKL